MEPASVFVVNPKFPDKVEKKLGTTPTEIELKSLKGKMLKLTQPGRLPQYVFPFETNSQKIELQLKLRTLGEVPEIHEEKDSIIDPNITHRLLMQSYDALTTEGDLAKALTLANELMTLSKRLASPRVIRGLVFLQRGETAKARREFQTARDLDPQDPRITTLLDAASDGL